MTGKKLHIASVKAKLPVDLTLESKHKRMELFKQFDPNSNGYLSLAEVDKGIRDVLNIQELFDLKPVIMRAFQAAKGANDKKNKAGSLGPDYVEKCEFRLLMVYLGKYFELYELFSEVDADDDHRIDIGEFRKAVPVINSWGAHITDVDATFEQIDRNGGGIILFDEFAHWALSKHLDELHPDE
ncbi:flagellar calcium-binding protein, putative [Bodo saltans]|uniref:Flagellar calcium-binding protein, putative n=1 Tax=Bodo saltans TaxID=75058 RepID=A0A0S4J8L5_BODSA|nr:flagellar calcium-binding protein, putative [Bodo saltans]|eukprot:CUG86447.1 flagellar calcium-binding protein, putative [Bodo saltans]